MDNNINHSHSDKNAANNPEQNQHVTVELDMPFLKNLTGWAAFKAVIDIIVGSLFCLSFFLIFPAVFGVLKIISGVKLLKATDDMKRYISTGQTQKIIDIFYNFNKYFRLSGISIIVQIVFIIIIFVLYIFAVVFFVSNPDFFEDIYGPGYF